jgi:hypothetical protein
LPFQVLEDGAAVDRHTAVVEDMLCNICDIMRQDGKLAVLTRDVTKAIGRRGFGLILFITGLHCLLASLRQRWGWLAQMLSHVMPNPATRPSSTHRTRTIT